MLKALIFVWLASVAFEARESQGWKGIVPLHTTCEEVQVILGISECVNKTYELEGAAVSITFSDGTCLSGWNVPRGTVLSIDVRPKPALKFVDLRLDQRKYRRVADRHDPNIVYYKNYHEGHTVAVMAGGMVGYMSYGPSAKDQHLRCPQKHEEQEAPGGDPAYWKIDEYGSISANEERARLDQFAKQMRMQPGK